MLYYSSSLCLQCKSRYNLFILTIQYVCSQGIKPMTSALRVAVELNAHEVDILSDKVNDLQPFVSLDTSIFSNLKAKNCTHRSELYNMPTVRTYVPPILHPPVLS